MRKLNVTDGRTDRRTDGQTDGGHCNISRPGPSAPREIKIQYNGGKKITSVKTRYKISHKTAERPRISPDMIGEGILILLDDKSGNMKWLFLRFCDER